MRFKTLLQAVINSFFKSITFYDECILLSSKKHHSQHMLIKHGSVSQKFIHDFPVTSYSSHLSFCKVGVTYLLLVFNYFICREIGIVETPWSPLLLSLG